MAAAALAVVVAFGAARLSDAARTSEVSGLEDTDLSSYPALCASTIVMETCQMLDAASKTNVDIKGIMDATSSSRKAAIGFWHELKLNSTHPLCAEFCQTLVSFFHQRKFVVPPTSDLGCYQEEAGRTKCDLNLSPQTISQAEPSGGDLPDFHQGEVKKQLLTPEKRAEEEEEEAEEQAEGLDYSVDELARRLGNLFRIYPELSIGVQVTDGASALLEGNETGGWWWRKSGPKKTWQEQLRIVSQKAQAYVTAALRQTLIKDREDLMMRWFGRVDAEGRKRIMLTLNSVDEMISNVEYVYPAPECDKQTYAYVYPTAGTCASSNLTKRACTKTTDGKFVFYMCELALKSSEAVQIETLTHEGSHHAVAYTDDVQFKGSTAYGRWTCKKLARAEPAKAVLNADNYCYYIQDVTDTKKR